MNPYEELGVPVDATQKEIKTAFSKKAQKVHPDKNPDDDLATEKFQRLRLAYDTLKDPNKRQQYDETGEMDEGSVSKDQQIMAYALNGVCDLFMQLASANDFKKKDYFPMMRERASQALIGIKQQRHDMQKELDNLRYLFDNSDLIEGVAARIQGQINAREQRIKSLDFNIAAMQKSKEILDQCSYMGEVEEMRSAGGYQQTHNFGGPGFFSFDTNGA